MLFFDGTLALVFVALWLFCVIDAITTPEAQVRNLPKIAWVFITILLMEIGAVAWLIAGRPRGRTLRAVLAGEAPTQGRGRALSPDDDEEFLAQLRVRAEEQRRRAAREQPKPPPEPSA